MKFTINNNLRLLTGSLLLAGAVCCSSGSDEPGPNPGPEPEPVSGDVRAYVTSANGNPCSAEEGLLFESRCRPTGWSSPRRPGPSTDSARP